MCGNITVVDSEKLISGHTKSCGCLEQENKIKLNMNKKEFNEYTIDNNIAYIKIEDKICLIDSEDLSKINNKHWTLDTNGYAICIKTRMHNLILGNSDKYIVIDHINRNKLDNRKENLRFVNRSENLKNSDYWDSLETNN